MPRLPEKCLICDEPYRVAWLDLHGIAGCITCGAPYQVFFYEGDGADAKRVEKPVELRIMPECVEWTRSYWKANRRHVCPGAFVLQGSRSDRADREDYEAFRTWLETHPVPAVVAEP